MIAQWAKESIDMQRLETISTYYLDQEIVDHLSRSN